MAGIIHPYYTVAIAPAVAALVGLGVAQLWRDRAAQTSRVTLAVVLALTVGWAWYLLAQTSWQPWLTWAVPLAGLAGVAGILGVHRMGGGPGRGNSEISQWVQQHFTAQTVGNQTVYDLTRPAS